MLQGGGIGEQVSFCGMSLCEYIDVITEKYSIIFNLCEHEFKLGQAFGWRVVEVI